MVPKKDPYCVKATVHLQGLERERMFRSELAEREGFEPPIPVKVCPLSRRIVSTTHAPLRAKLTYKRSGFRS
jgi:hypothetical protein